MTDIMRLLSPEQLAALERAKTLPPSPADACGAVKCKTRCEGYVFSGTVVDGFATCRCSHTEQTHTGARADREPSLAEAPVTLINGVEVDLRGEGMHQTECADCAAAIEVAIQPAGVDVVDKVRTAVCLDCGHKRLKGRQGEVLNRPAVIHDPNEEERVFDLTGFSNAELAAAAVDARERMVASAAAALPAKRNAANQQQAEREAADEKQKVADRAKLGKRKAWMGEFTYLGDKTVPALDFSEISNLDEAPSSKVRSPYNKVLHSQGEPLLDPEATTYRVLRKVHKRLWKAARVAVEMPKDVTPRVVETAPVLLADLDPDTKAKVDAYAEVTGTDTATARERLASLALI